MKKQATIILILLACAPLFSQVGIGTETPQATLDVTGIPANASEMDGIIAPRITGEQLRSKTYTAAQTGALVYVTTADPAPADQTIDVTAPGYYYFDGTKWILSSGTDSDTNIYNSNGTLTDHRTLTLGGSFMWFTGATQRTEWDSNGRLAQKALSSSPTKHASMLFSAADNNGNGITSSGWLQIYPESGFQIIASNDATSLQLSASNTTGPGTITFSTNPGGQPANVRAQIAGDGRFNIVNKLSIGYSTPTTFGSELLKINGSIVTAGGSYPDYVFENYFDNSSDINSEYKFQSIYEVESFLKTNKHLPGVTSIKELEKTENGYLFNVSELSIQSLEKIEELYLYTIEQQKQIDKLTKLVEELQQAVEIFKE